MIRRAYKEDIVAIATAMKEFEKESRFVHVNPQHCYDSYGVLLDNGVCALWVMEKDGKIVGGTGGVKVPDLHCGALTAIETFWFVQPEYRGQGLKLFDAFEAWAREEGCKRAAMIHMVDSMPERLEVLYRRRGYTLLEKHYIKEL